jgi:hypothetical protein
MWPTKLSRCGIITDNTLCPASGPKLKSYISADEFAFAHPQAHVGIPIEAIKLGSVFHENLEHTACRRGRGYVILRANLHRHAPVPKSSNDDIEIAPAFPERHPGRSAIAASNRLLRYERSGNDNSFPARNPNLPASVCLSRRQADAADRGDWRSPRFRRQHRR